MGRSEVPPLPFEVAVFHLSVVLLSLVSAIWPTPSPPVSERWHAWPVVRVFPGSVPGHSPSGARVTYLLAGVAPEAPCLTAFQPAAVRPGCRVALRATYADSTQTFVVTVGIAVLDAPGTGHDGSGRPATVRPAAFPGGPAERFGDRQYFAGTVVGSGERYLVATAAGYSDGRVYRPGDHLVPRLRDAARQLATALHQVLTR
ncbi:hypothetical protein BKM31_48890 [[Actinomadura] parvosata subsp. kistnae]|uniref:Uncharacterized protein n=1 Tax=[Actinomadura] parvosata subsp. kistnae TaxID=1909395 RepID=A0A1V0ADN5_9ACTN|nr:hypothetical protein [Nonomuraea sp. ATCC 55076]AQZ68334.1 hypothetical protein BKM31_48890 [Nonomuraea sp. ATCC 55076]